MKRGVGLSRVGLRGQRCIHYDNLFLLRIQLSRCYECTGGCEPLLLGTLLRGAFQRIRNLVVSGRVTGRASIEAKNVPLQA